MAYIKPFSGLGKYDAPSAGGKGASLGEMTQAGIPVPGGFVILADAFEHFLKETDLNVEIEAILSTVHKDEMHTVEHASEKIRGLILEAVMPVDIKKDIEEQFAELDSEYVAVRSSATAEDGAEHAWAGQLDSFLNTTKDSLLTSVQRCWASLFTPRAIFYRFEKGLHSTKISVAVVVQKMVNSEVSGIAFSVHPVTEDYNQLIIEAGFGLGEAIVSGSVTPDSYVVEKTPRKILDVNVATQTRALYRVDGGGNEWHEVLEPKASSQVLTKEQILELSELILKIEQHYGFPCDIEWAYEAGKFFIVQSRPITTLKKRADTSSFVTETNAIQWTKNWEGKFSLTFSLLGLEMSAFQRSFGFGPSSALLFYKDGVSSCFFADEEMAVFGQRLVETVQSDKTRLDAWISQTRADIDAVHRLKNEEVSDESFNEIKTLLHRFGVYAFALKELSNYLPADLQAEMLPKIEDVRKYGETVYFDTSEYISHTLSLLAQQTQLPTHLLECLTPEECIQYFTNKELPGISILESRHTGCGVFFNPTPHFFNKQEVAQVQSCLFKDIGKDVLKGQPAFSGIVQGVCVVVKKFTQELDIPEGSVLVTGMTDPRFVPLMKKARAIVTDAGGALCHAAIVSRELQIPCIVGTKFATELLKDGDLVEVDADNGVVRVLERVRENRTVMVNMQSREHSLTYCHVWQIANQTQTRGWFESVGNILFVNNGAHKKTRVWYGKKELENIFVNTGTRAQEEKDFFDRVSREFVSLTDELVPYCEGKKRIESLEEWKWFYEKWVEWWAPMAIIFVLPESTTASESIRQRALALRVQTEKYSDSGDRLVMEYLYRQYPAYREEIEFMTPEEILHIGDLTDMQVEEIKTRKNGYIFFNGKLYPRNELDSMVKKFQLHLEEPAIQSSSEIKGYSASHGKVTGSVIVVYGKKDLERVTMNSILVTEMTSPDYVPYLKKVAAIVTDEGGINCHAAIVARELKKPCIIGTKIATQVLKDGDLVEVDADNGVVRVLERGGGEKHKATPLQRFKEKVGNHEVFTIRGGYSPLFMELTYLKYKDFPLYVVNKADDTLFAFDFTVYKKYAIDAFEQYMLGNLQLHHFANLYSSYQKKLDNLYRIYTSKQLDSVSEEELVAMLKDLLSLFDNICSDTLFIEYFTSELAQQCMDSLHISRVNMDHILEKVSRIPFESFEKRHERLKIEGLKKYHGAITSALINELKYVYTDYRETKPDEQIIQDLEKYGNRDVVEQQVVDVTKENLTKDFSATEKLIFDYCAYISHLRDTRKDEIAKVITLLQLGTVELGRRVGLTKYDVFRTVLTEFFEGTNGLKPKVSEIKKRKTGCEGYAISLEDNIMQSGDVDIDAIEKDLTGVSEKEVTELKGEIASTGIVRGVIRVINDIAKKNVFNEGDVLVTSMTRPEFVPLMKTAGAIVTNEGGITCHAAIVSRELKKPCIIGTKIATQVLKDGDLVEVDADNGVVRVLERVLEQNSELQSKKQSRFEGDWTVVKSSVSPLIGSYNVDAWVKVAVSRYGDFAPLKTFLCLIVDSGNQASMAISIDEYVSSAKYLLAHKEILDEIFYDFDQDEVSMLSFVNDLESNKKNIVDHFLVFMDKYNAMYSSGVMFDGFLIHSDEMLAVIKAKYENTLHEDIGQLTKAPDLNFSQREELELLHVALSDASKHDQLLQEHQVKYHWVLNNYKAVIKLPVAYFKGRLDGFLKLDESHLKEKITELESYKANHETEVARINKEARISQHDIDQLTLLGKVGWYVDRRKACNLLGNHWIGAYISAMCTLHNLNNDDALLLTVTEFESVLRKERSMSDFNFEERKNEMGLAFLIDDQEVILGNELKDLKRAISPVVDTNVSILNGNTANKGIVRGLVRVVNFVGEKNFVDGEVLVTSMTRPDFVPLMRKAIAIVTDEGGVTSHAAIISRELKKPCIIGTKIATQVLHDGDLVEVDADNGVVRVLERKR